MGYRQREKPSSEEFQKQALIVQQVNWDQNAAIWETDRQNQGLNEVRLDLFCRSLAGPDVLLVGCGQGQNLVHLQKTFARVTGVDWSPAMIERARESGFKEVMVADAAALPFPDQQFDAVILATGILLPCHSREIINDYLREALRVVGLGRRVAVCIFYEEGNREAASRVESLQWPLDTIRCFLFWDLRPVRDAVSSCGAKIIEMLHQGDFTVILVENE